MPKRSRFLALLLPLALFPAFPTSANLHAQAATAPSIPAAHDNAADDSDNEPVSSLFVSVRLDESAHVSVNANLFVPKDKQPGVASIKSALETTLSCRLIDDPLLHTTHKAAQGFYLGSCDLPRSPAIFLHQGSLRITPLLDLGRNANIQLLGANLFLPSSDLAEVIPPPTASPKSLSAAPTARSAGRRHPPRMFFYNWKLDQPIPSQISFRFGYLPAQINRNAIYLSLILLAPLALVFWLGRKALSADVPDKAVVWFSYMRSLSWILNGSLLAWWAALDFFQVQQVLRFIAAGTSFAPLLSHPAARQCLGWLPPSIIWLACYRLSHPIQEKLRGLHWTKRELTLQALYSTLAGLFPFAMFLTGINLLSTSGSSAAAWFIAAGLVRAFAAKALLQLTGMQPHALTTGPLRDRAFSMADQLGVKLQQVYLIPSGKGQMANAFASSGNNISFTDFLLQRMSQREVDYVMAHELTHLKLQHPSKLGMARIGGFFLGGVLLTAFTLALPGANSIALRYLLIFAAMTAFPFFISRRFEYAADAGAVAVTNDPRSAISALFKLSQLNMLPTQWNKWSEKWLSHPSSLRRAQAIARKAGIPVEQIPSIAQEGSSSDASTYASPTIAAATNKLHSTQHKKASIQKLSYILLAIISFVPSLFALFAQSLHGHRALQLSLLALSIPATFAAVLVFSNYIPRLTRGNISSRLNQKLSVQGIQVASWGGIYVGFAPSAAPRSYEATSFWDVGYLFLRSDRLCYWGEEAQFALRRDQITDIKLDTGLPGYLGAKRVYIAWCDAEQGTCGVFNLGRGHSDSIRGGARQTSELANRLHAWWKTPSPARALPAPLDTLSTPVVRAVTSAVPGALWKPQKLFSELLATAWIAALAAMLCRLPFHLTAYLNSATYSRLGLPSFSSPGAGWFIVLVAPLVRYLSLIPALRYRDKPILVAQSSTKGPTTAPPSPNPSPSPVTTRDPIPVP